MKKLVTASALLVLLAGSGLSYAMSPAHPAAVADWVPDSAHTEIKFSVNHFFTPVTGSFEDFDLTLEYDVENPENSLVEARIAVASVNTGNERRNEHLRTPDFFAAEEHPYITFRSESVTDRGDGKLVARGPLTIRGTTRQIELPITLLGVQPIPGEMREMLGGAEEIASFRAATTIDRGDFGVGTGSWAATMVVGGDVDIEILVEAHRK